MSEQQDPIRQKIKQLANASLDNPSAWFETFYAESQGDTSQIPWAKLTAHPYLQDWLNTHTPKKEQPTALIIGCGLGDDAEAFAQKGYQVTAFDISPTAINWCQQRFPDSKVNYVVADLLATPPAWHQAFDLVYECRTIQGLPINIRSQVTQAVADLVAVEGILLVISSFRENEAETDGPPWRLSASEFAQFTQLGLTEISRLPFALGDVPHLRVEFQNSPVK
ncbi:MAG TPA: class I SAM-dependent methyltransferase [Nostocaceae cyanobacterium]|nr:class I SAM-dependent methyltransferase [Nostocaceae cyanobacterium]